ncbi:DNA mismatch repair protein MutS [Flaviaesturariibacter flavus]|uniref:DNA mismatch repair protein MutS n=1 Tax=Flaviaesturariibacter flavus TaxID=2502780 RepID=A0A4R1BKJ3_9BACT|nr:DNA mismatch repair protein MutS [Flaviaesturariibacter flavus]TCJ17846.1 DNA mismatch repair protein MutS [Flaviaesturariibacter flavus]
MQIDKITTHDLAIFQSEEEFSVFHRLNFTKTAVGKEWLRRFFQQPHGDLQKIRATQEVLRLFQERGAQWPPYITNGTMLVIDKFLDYELDAIPASLNRINSFSYRVLHPQDYSMARFSVRHFADFYRGLRQLLVLFADVELPRQVSYFTDRIRSLLREEPLERLAALEPGAVLSIQETLYYAYHVRGRYKNSTLELIDVFGRLEAWYSMAAAMTHFGLQFPRFVDSAEPQFNARGLYHVLIPNPVAYDLVMDPQQNFVFLTGANMAGKSTLIKAVGAAVYLAHLGMGVPAAAMELSLFDGLLSNINVTDNLVRGESYFFNEVQRIKNTIVKINDGKKWLVLIDELFKGTNVQDAMKCSLAVIKGLVKMRNSLFILSTHLYEIGEELKVYPNIAFKFFETKVANDQLSFSYQLRDGISDDRIGYVILRREKVVDLLESLGENG